VIGAHGSWNVNTNNVTYKLYKKKYDDDLNTWEQVNKAAYLKSMANRESNIP
jgi:hypothetical protein